MSYRDWKVGTRVIYVNEHGTVSLRGPWRKRLGISGRRLSHNLVHGETYTIEGLRTHHCDDFGHVVCIYVRGFRFRENGAIAFPACWFKRPQERKTDIAIFTEMLTSTKQPVEV